MEHQHTSRFGYVAIIMGLVSGLCAVSAVISYHAYFAARSDYDALRAQHVRLMERSLLLYGDIESVDPVQSTVTIRFRNQFVTADDPVILKVHINEKTKLVKESLIGINGAYIAMTDSVDGKISDLLPGMRVSALLDNVPSERRIDAQFIFFGNPL